MTSRLAAVLVMALSVRGYAQVPAREIQIAGAVSAAPEPLRAGAMVLGYSNYHRLTTLRPGSNELICLADDPAEPRWHVACYHRDLEPFMARGRQLEAEGAERARVDSVRLAEIQGGSLKMPDGPRMLYSLFAPGDSVDRASGLARGARGLDVVYIPYATAEQTGLPVAPSEGMPWIMYAGKPWAHIMIMR